MELLTLENAIALVSLVAMELVLGIDNVIFISILTDRLPPSQRDRVARVGLGLALVFRVGLLLLMGRIMALTAPLVRIASLALSGRDLVLLIGGLFLVAKATTGIYRKVEAHAEGQPKSGASRVGLILAQIVALDLVFSLDSIITAIGMVPPDRVWIMVVAVLVSVVAMLATAKPLGAFVTRHPSLKILALSFLVVIGVMLVAEALGQHVGKGTIYFAMAFSLVVELVNMRFRKRREAAAAAPTTPSGAASAPGSEPDRPLEARA
jgi:predicted tellurium resistance membrane protein TerC